MRPAHVHPRESPLLARFIERRPAKVAMIAGSRSYRAHEEREMGFLHYFEELAPEIEVVACARTCRERRLVAHGLPGAEASVMPAPGGPSGTCQQEESLFSSVRDPGPQRSKSHITKANSRQLTFRPRDTIIMQMSFADWACTVQPLSSARTGAYRSKIQVLRRL